MENCILVNSVKQIKGVFNFQRLYFGSEFCGRLVPSQDELKKALDLASEKKAALSLVSGYSSEEEIKKYEGLLKVICSHSANTELIINDWGILELSRGFPVTPILGRLLARQKKDPQVLKIFNFLPEITKKRYQSVAINRYFADFLKENRIYRVEIDNLSQGLDLGNPEEDIRYSLYSPYAYITTTRLCPTSACNGLKNKPLIIPQDCKYDCLDKFLSLAHRNFGGPLILKGNTVFYKNESFEQALENKNIDRIVFQPPFKN